MKNTGCYLLALALVLGPVLQMCAAQNGGGKCGSFLELPAVVPPQCLAKGIDFAECQEDKKCKGLGACCLNILTCKGVCVKLESGGGTCPAVPALPSLESCPLGVKNQCGKDNKCAETGKCCFLVGCDLLCNLVPGVGR
ncbi:uncharacterized protein LOC144764027 [Lissotriton helveticus]